MPLDVCGAESQAQIGYLLGQALRNEFAARGIRRGVACVITQVLVDDKDPAFANPTKPIGPYYTREDEIVVKKAKGWKMVLDQRGGWRRVVPSPKPIEIVEAEEHLAAGQFPPGSMGPKIEAAIDFLEGGGERVVITDLEHLVPAAAGKAGTRIGKK